MLVPIPTSKFEKLYLICNEEGTSFDKLFQKV
jgi:hypothetical protein